MINDRAPSLQRAVQRLILDKNGNKMSKRLGNTDPFTMLDKYGMIPCVGT